MASRQAGPSPRFSWMSTPRNTENRRRRRRNDLEHETEREFGWLDSPYSDINHHHGDSDSDSSGDTIPDGMPMGGMVRCGSVMDLRALSAGVADEERESRWSKLGHALLKERKVRQFFEKKTLVREAFEKKVAYEELLLDLCVVFNFAFLSHILTENFKNADSVPAVEVENFALLLGLVFLAWRLNAFRFNILSSVGSDLANKAEVLILLLSFTGLGVGASSAFKSGSIMAALSGFTALSLPSIVLIAGTWDSPLYRKGTSRFKNHAVIRGIGQLICALPYAVICVFPRDGLIKPLFYVGFVGNVVLDIFLDIVLRLVFQNESPIRFYAVNIETWTERHSLLTLVSFGESALTMLYVVDGIMRAKALSRVEAARMFLSISCLFLLLFSYVTQYFDIDNRIAASDGAAHAVRRSVVSGVAWSLLHYFLIFGLVSVAVGYGIVMSTWFEYDLTTTARGGGGPAGAAVVSGGVFLTTAEAIVSFSLVLLSLTHRRSEREVTKGLRLLLRTCFSAVYLGVIYRVHCCEADSTFHRGVQWAYTVAQSLLTVVEYSVIRMDTGGWWAKAPDSVSSASSSTDDSSYGGPL